MPEWLRKKACAERQKLFRERHPEAVAKNALKQKLTRDWISSLKENPCADCKGWFPYYCMDRDHVRGEKLTTVADLRKRNASLQRTLDEIAKCDLVCSNCHRIRTYARSMAKAGSG